MQYPPPKPQRAPRVSSRADFLREQAKRRRQVRLRRTMVLAGLLAVSLTLLLTVVLPSGASSPLRQVLSPGAAAPEAPPQPVEEPGLYGSPAAEAMGEQIDEIIDANGGHRIGVAVIDPEEGLPHVYGDAETFTAASTAKILTAAAYYHLVETGEASLEKKVGAFKARFQIEAMVNASSNEAWLVLMKAIGFEELTAYAESIGITYDPLQNTLTPAEMASLLNLLHAGTLLDEENTEELLGFMQDTNNETLIPSATPSEVTVHHKYGALGPILHDAAILSQDGKTYILVVYTENVDNSSELNSMEIIHEVTEAVITAAF
jgi:beta-lactamase class A